MIFFLIYMSIMVMFTTGANSDALGFLQMKDAYLKTRGMRSKFWFLHKPVTLEFVQVSFSLTCGQGFWS